MLQDLDKTLKALLELQLPSDLLSGNTNLTERITFDSPTTEYGKRPSVNLFLYDVRENLDLRNTVGSFDRQNGLTAIKKRPPARVDCSYMITAWGPAGSSLQDLLEEHKILGEVMKVLLRFPSLPAEVLQGSLVGQDPPVRLLSLRPGHFQNPGDFWQAMGGNPKAALNYTITISVPVDEEGISVPLVTEQRVDLTVMEGA